MLTTNPFVELPGYVPALALQVYVILMIVLVVAGTLVDIVHKKSARYFFEAAENARQARSRDVDSGEKSGIAMKTLVHDVLASGEFCNPRRRMAHLLTMYGFLAYVITTVIMVFGTQPRRPHTRHPAAAVVPGRPDGVRRRLLVLVLHPGRRRGRRQPRFASCAPTCSSCRCSQA